MVIRPMTITAIIARAVRPAITVPIMAKTFRPSRKIPRTLRMSARPSEAIEASPPRAGRIEPQPG
jgi:hypothetical protein